MKYSTANFIAGFLVCVWLLLWFMCIWIDVVRWKLFFTGVFCFFAALLFYDRENHDAVKGGK